MGHDLPSNILLPYEVVAEILIRVRKRRSRARLKCVSREWNRMLSHDPWFKEMHRNHKRRARRAWILRMSPNRVPTGGDHFTVHCEVKDSEKGALIKEFALPHYYFDGVQRDPDRGTDPIRCGSLLFYRSASAEALYLYDIRTDRVLRQLPRPGPFPSHLRAHGFGYSYKSGKYTVVRLCRTSRWGPSSHVMNCEVYSARRGDAFPGWWRLISEKCPCLVWGSGVFANNRVHWMSRVGVRFALVSFDLYEEIFTTVPFTDLEEYCMRGRLANLEGRLCLVNQPDSYSGERDMMRLRVWAVRDYGEGTWECWCDVDLGFVYGEERLDARRFGTFGLAYAGEEELVFVARFGKDDYAEVYCDMRESRVARVVHKTYGPIILCGTTRL